MYASGGTHGNSARQLEVVRVRDIHACGGTGSGRAPCGVWTSRATRGRLCTARLSQSAVGGEFTAAL